MTEKGRLLYEEAEKAYEEYKHNCTCAFEVLDNLHIMLELCDDTFLECFTHEFDTTIDYNVSDNDDGPTYDNPSVCFRLKKIPRAFFEILCHGIICCDETYFNCQSYESNYPSVQAFLDYFIGKFGDVAGLKK